MDEVSCEFKEIFAFFGKKDELSVTKWHKETTDFIRSHISMDKFVMVNGKIKFLKTKEYLSVINCEAPLDVKFYCANYN